MLTLYGIPSCDSCRKARKYLESQNVEYVFHDVRTDGVDRDMLHRWLRTIEWRALLNTRSTTWRTLVDDQKSDVDQERAVELMLAHPTLIKRPVAESDEMTTVGFSAERYAAFAD